MVPVDEGAFTLDDYVGYVREFIRHIGAERLHVIAVCQPDRAGAGGDVSLMAARGEPEPRTHDDDGRPDRRAPQPDRGQRPRHAASRCDWFETNLIHAVPHELPGRAAAASIPGFLQHAGFIAMNPMRHFNSHWDFYQDLVEGDLDDADEHRRFYDEYNAVLDMPAEYYLDCDPHRVPASTCCRAGCGTSAASASRPRRSRAPRC